MKKRKVARAQKRKRRNKKKYAEKLENQHYQRAKTRKKQKLYKNPNRALRRFWDKVLGKRLIED